MTRRAANWNLILALGFLGIAILSGVILGIVIDFGCAELRGEQQSLYISISEARAQEQISDVEGYGILVEGLASGIYALPRFAARVAFVIGIGITLGLAVVVVLIAVIARIVYAKSHRRFQAYRICVAVQHALSICFPVGFLIALLRVGNVFLCWIPIMLLIYALIAAWIGLRQMISNHALFHGGEN